MEAEFFKSEPSIIANAEAAGYKIKHKGLKRLYDDDLAGHPRQHHEKGQIGSETFYPAGTTERVLLISEICQRKRRSSEYIGWHLWWRNCEVPERYWTRRLQEIASWYDLWAPKLGGLFFENGDDELSARGLLEIKKLRSPQARIKSALFRQLRKRLTPDAWDTFMRIVFEIQNGRFRGWNPDINISDKKFIEYKKAIRYIDPRVFDLRKDKAIFDRGLGLDIARTQHLPGQKPWLEGDIDAPIAMLSRVLSGLRLTNFLKTLSDSEIRQARDEIRIILASGVFVSNAFRSRFGKYVLGFGVVAEFASKLEVRVHGLMLLFWLALRREPGMAENVDRFLNALPPAISGQLNRGCGA